MDEPRYGYGKGGRLLWSPRDCDAETIRQVLRRAGVRDVGERNPDGFAVEGASSSENGGEPFSVACCGAAAAPATVRLCRRALEEAGLRVSGDPHDGNVLLVQRPGAPVHAVPHPGRVLIGTAVALSVLAAVGLVVSWAASGQARLIGGISSGVLGCLALFLAGLWYRRRLDEEESDAQGA